MARSEHQLKIRIASDLKDWLEERARKNLRSVNNEVVLALLEKRDRETETAGEPFKTTPTV